MKTTGRSTGKPGLNSLGSFLYVILLFAMLVGCSPSNSFGTGASVEELGQVDYKPLPGDDWAVSSPQEQGLDPDLVAELYYDAGHLETIYSLLVIKNGYLIGEDYFNEGSIDQKDRLQSVTKSFTSSLVGIALEQGCLSSVDQKFLEFFPEVADGITDPRKEQITIRNMLEMRSGYPNEETHEDLWAGLLSGHYPPLIEAFPLVSDPGDSFHYSNLSSNWLGIIVDRACGMSLRITLKNIFFHPLIWRSVNGARMQKVITMAVATCTSHRATQPNSACCISTMANIKEIRSFLPIGCRNRFKPIR